MSKNTQIILGVVAVIILIGIITTAVMMSKKEVVAPVVSQPNNSMTSKPMSSMTKTMESKMTSSVAVSSVVEKELPADKAVPPAPTLPPELDPKNQ